MAKGIVALIIYTIILNNNLIAQNEYSIVLAGDAIITRPLSVYEEPQFLEMIKFIRKADAAFVNLEMLFHDYESFPMHQSGGTYMRGDPKLAKELTWAGFDMVSTANNHTGDYGPKAMELTLHYVDKAGLIHAGAGQSLAEAREARFLETAHGRIALISCSSTFPDHSRAGKSRDDIPPRPGLSPVRHTTTQMVDKETMDHLKAVAKKLDPDLELQDSTLRLFRQDFKLADRITQFSVPNEEDVFEISQVVNNASRLSEITMVSIHAHERKGDLENPADFIRTFAQKMIDAGADVVIGHGPHILRAIEIYKGKPIIYSLGDFMFQNESLLRLPVENYARYELDEHTHVADFNAKRYKNDTEGFPARPKVWESVLAKLHCQADQIQSISLHPITLGYGKPVTERGRPMFANPDLGAKILQDLIDLSDPIGTQIEIKEGVGWIYLNE